MKISMVMTLIGEDRPGLVEAVSAVIEEHGGNWLESRMAHLAGQFAGLIHAHVPADRAGDLETALGRLEGLSVAVARSAGEEPPAEEPPADTHPMTLDVLAPDQPGIVHQLTEVVAALGINVEGLKTEVHGAPMSGEKLFRAKASLRAPAGVTQEALEEALEEIAGSLLADVTIDEPEAG